MYPQPLDALPAEVKNAENNFSEVSVYPPPSLMPVVRAGRLRNSSSWFGVTDWVLTFPSAVLSEASATTAWVA